MVLPILYDQLHREDLRQRAEARDAELDVGLEMTKINKGILELAKSRLPQVLNAVGTEPRSSRHAERPDTASTLLSTQGASLRAMLDKQSQAQQGAAKQNQSLLDRQTHLLGSLQDGSVVHDYNGKGKDKKRGAEWVAGVQEYKKQKGHSKGHRQNHHMGQNQNKSWNTGGHPKLW